MTMTNLRRGLGLALFYALSGACVAQTENQDKKTPPKPNSKIKTQTLTLKRGDEEIKCYFAVPAEDGAHPGILVIHEWWGLNDWTKEQADRFAEKGYAALAVDLYRGQVAADRDHAHELSRGLPEDRAVEDLRVAFQFLTGHKATRDKKCGVIGWCMGGGYALKLAIAEPTVAATVVCYGSPVVDVERLKKIKGAILGIWGGADRGIDVKSFEAALKKAGTKVAGSHTYPGAKHAFMNSTNKDGYNKDAAEKAWKEIDAFFAKELK